jgi:hypothetical protein
MKLLLKNLNQILLNKNLSLQVLFRFALTTAFIFAAVLCFIAAAFSALRGGKYVYKEKK